MIAPTPRPVLRTLVPVAALLACALALHPACSSNGPGGGPDAGSPDGGNPGGGPDAGKPDAGPKPCTLDKDCGSARWCETSSGACRDAKACPQGQSNCDYQSPADYCGNQACYCDPADQSCKPRHLPCTACATSDECGNNQHALAFDFPANCAPAGAFAPGAVCIPLDNTPYKCPQGYLLPTDGGVFCTPAGGRCGAAGGCGSDQECDPHSALPICDSGRKVCVAACSFDLKTGDSSCPTGQTCHLIPGLKDLPPQDPNFGKGHCAPACTAGAGGTNCGQGLVCRSEGIDHPVQRCGLPPPKCMGDVECPDSAAAHAQGYCDLVAHDCKTDCRSSTDCKPGYGCNGATGTTTGTCVAETCLQAGGAAAGCDYGQFCCSETSAPACPGGTASGACFDAPQATWCGTCSKNDDCRTGSFPSRAGLPNLCVQVGQNKDVCALGCEVGKSPECPRGWGCTKVYVGCKTDSDCGPQTGARCNNPDGGSDGTCACSTNDQCPNKAHQASDDTSCDTGSGKCIFSAVCRPNCP